MAMAQLEDMKIKRPIMSVEEAWQVIEPGMSKLERRVDGKDAQLTGEEFMEIYTVVYNTVWQKPPNSLAIPLNNKIKECFSRYITREVFPTLKSCKGKDLLQDLLKGWGHYKVFVRSTYNLFRALDSVCFRYGLLGLDATGPAIFKETAFLPLKKRIKHCIEEIIQGQEKGETADEELLREMLALVAELDLKGDIETTLHKGIEDFNKAHDAVFSKEQAADDGLRESKQDFKGAGAFRRLISRC